MKVKCISELLNKEQAIKLGDNCHIRQSFGIKKGTEYLVYGLSFKNGEPWVALFEPVYIYGVPLCLFNIIDNRVSKYWTIARSETEIYVWPELFNTDYFFEDLADEKPEIRNKFFELKKLMDNEFDE